jgi:hypothetical protein
MTIDLFNLPPCNRCHGRGAVAVTVWEGEGLPKIRQVTCPDCAGAGSLPDPLTTIQARYALNPDFDVIVSHAVEDIYWLVNQVDQLRSSLAKATKELHETHNQGKKPKKTTGMKNKTQDLPS